MIKTTTHSLRRLGQRFASNARVLPAVFALAALAAPSRSPAQLPTPIDLGNLGGGGASVSAVADGYAVGQSGTSSGATHAFVWSASTRTMLDISALIPGGTPYSGATSVNSHGAVVGAAWAPDWSSMNGFYWSEATGVVSLGALYPNFAQTTLLINENGVVAGVTADGRLFRWTVTGGFTYLGSPPFGYYPYIAGINSRGDIIGGSGDLSTAFIALGSASTLTLLMSPGIALPPNNVGYTENMGGVNIQLNAINDSGVVVGTYWDFQYIYYGYYVPWGGFFSAEVHNSHAFKWNATGGFTDLGNLGTYADPGNPNPLFNSSANAINNSGVIVGTSSLSGGGSAPWIYDPSVGHLTQMPGASTDFGPVGINDDGYVAGSANAQMFAVLWKNGVSTTLNPTFAPMYDGAPGSPLIKGGTVAGTGFDTSWNGHAWVLGLPSARPPAPVVTSNSVTANYGSTFSYQIVATNSPASYGATGLLAGLTLNSLSGAITGTLPNVLGTFPIDLSATNAGGTGTGTLTLTIVDPTPPLITKLTPSTATIWPPNKKMVAITLSPSGANLGSGVTFKITSVTTNEPDGSAQWQITGPLALNLLADRLGTGTGRVYTITVVATDVVGNTSTANCTVTVPHDQGKK